jgi:TolA-binding protein
MPPLINELFQEAIQKSTDFASKAQAATAEVAEIAQGAEALGRMAVDEAETLHQAMAAVLGAIHTAREELDAEAGRTASVLHGLPARAETTQVAVEALLAGVHDDVTHLSELRVRLLSRVDESAQQASTELETLETRVHELQQKLDARLNEANGHLEKLQHAVEEGRTQLAEEERHLREAIQSLGVLATDKAHAFVAAVQAALLVLGRRIVDFCNHVADSHNDAMMAWRSHVTDETPATGAPEETWVHQALQPVRDALTELAAIPEPAAQALHDSVAAITADANHALQQLQSVAYSLQHAIPVNLPTMGS